MLSFLLICLSLMIYQVFWCCFIKDFKIHKIFYFISVILTISIVGFSWYLKGAISSSLIPYSLILLILTNLSFIDCKYYEVSGHSYWFLLLPALTIPILNYDIFLEYIICAILYFVFFFIVDKIVGIEKIGGADVKILLILALTISFWDSFSLLAISFLLDTILFILKFPIDKIFGKKEKTKIPMIVAITIAWILVCFMYA